MNTAPYPGLHPSSMIDDAPISSTHVRRHLALRADIPDAVLMKISIVTMVNARGNAETRVDVPRSDRFDEQERWFQELSRAVPGLPGCARSFTITMGRWIIVEWDGIRRPV